MRTLSQAVAELNARRAAGQKIAFTNGCFDVLHVGHVQYLMEARAQADCLVVGLNSDSSVRELKGAGRPVNPMEARAAVLSGLAAGDQVVVSNTALLRTGMPVKLAGAGQPGVN